MLNIACFFSIFLPSTFFLTTSTPLHTLSRHLHASWHQEDYPVPHIQRLGPEHHQGQLAVPRIHEHKVRTLEQEIL